MVLWFDFKKACPYRAGFLYVQSDDIFGSITDSMGSFNPYIFHRPVRTGYSSPGLRRELSRTANDEGVSPWVVLETLKSSALN